MKKIVLVGIAVFMMGIITDAVTSSSSSSSSTVSTTSSLSSSSSSSSTRLTSNPFARVNFPDDEAYFNYFLSNAYAAGAKQLENLKELDKVLSMSKIRARLINQKPGDFAATPPLVYVLSAHNKDLFKLLLKYNPDIRYRANMQETSILNNAITDMGTHKDPFYFNELLKHYPSLLESRNMDNQTPLLLIVADISQENFHALRMGLDKESLLDVARILLEKGADIYARDGNGYTAFDYAEGKVPGCTKRSVRLLAMLNEAKTARERAARAQKEIAGGSEAREAKTEQ
jgi:ankyrin repeat protein